MQINIEQGSSPVQQSFFFEAIPNKILEQKQTKQILTKWGLYDTLRVGSFRFNQQYQDYDNARFLNDLFSNPNVIYVMNNIPALAIESKQKVKEIQFNKLRCTQLSMEIFDELEKQKIVSGKYISKTMPDFFQGIEICDKLRETLIMEESQSYCTFDQAQRSQFILKLFQLLVIGGSLNQYEDQIGPYYDWTKKIYKSLVAVRKRPDSNEIFIESHVYQILSISKDKIKNENPQNVLYAIINPSLRTVHLVSNVWKKFW